MDLKAWSLSVDSLMIFFRFNNYVQSKELCRNPLLNPGYQATKIAEYVVWFWSMKNREGAFGKSVF